MENSNEKIKKYNISEKDLYTLGIIEAKKSTAGFFEKEKLKAKSMGVLKPYNIKFIDLGTLLGEIKKQEYHTNQNLIEKYGNIDLESTKSSMGLKYSIPIIGCVAVLFYFIFMSGPSACDCANLRDDSPMNKEYTPQQLNDGDFLRREADKHVEKAKKCAEIYGKLDDMEKELARTATEMTWIPKLNEAIENAKKECGK